MDKIIDISGKKVGFRATALTPRLYRHKMQRDIIQDFNRLQKAFAKAAKINGDMSEEELRESQLSVLDLEIFENIAFVMARQYDPTAPDSPEEWLEQFEMFSVYEIMPELIDLWNLNNKTTAKPKKK